LPHDRWLRHPSRTSCRWKHHLVTSDRPSGSKLDPETERHRPAAGVCQTSQPAASRVHTDLAVRVARRLPDPFRSHSAELLEWLEADPDQTLQLALQRALRRRCRQQLSHQREAQMRPAPVHGCLFCSLMSTPPSMADAAHDKTVRGCAAVGAARYRALTRQMHKFPVERLRRCFEHLKVSPILRARLYRDAADRASADRLPAPSGPARPPR
jgi:hypothetical protein